MQSERERKVFEILRIGMIDEDTDDGYERRQTFDDLSGSSGVDIAGAVWIEVQTNGISAQIL